MVWNLIDFLYDDIVCRVFGVKGVNDVDVVNI